MIADKPRYLDLRLIDVALRRNTAQAVFEAILALWEELVNRIATDEPLDTPVQRLDSHRSPR